MIKSYAMIIIMFAMINLKITTNNKQTYSYSYKDKTQMHAIVIYI